MVRDDGDRAVLVLVVHALRIVPADRPPLLVSQRLEEPDEPLLRRLEVRGVALRAAALHLCHPDILAHVD